MDKIADWSGPGGTLSNDLYVPAIMMVAGRGFTDVDTNAAPELRAFLDHQITTFDTAFIPEDIALRKPAPAHLFHRYLIYFVASVWRVSGVSWHAIKVLLVALLFVCAVLVYAISRQALPPACSGIVAVAYVLSDGVLMTLYHLRDFSKAPFILFVILLLCMAIKQHSSGRRYILLAFLIGCSFGIGMGFRRDMLALLPLALAVLVSCRLYATNRSVLIKTTAFITAMITFLFFSYPILAALYPERAINTHDMIMGFSSRADRETGMIVPASYEKHFLLDDNYSTFQAYRAAKLGISVSRDEFLKKKHAHDALAYDYYVKRNYVLYMAQTFPADMLVRSFAAVLRITTGIFRNRFEPFVWLEICSFPLLIAAFLVLAASDPYRAWQIIALVCFFCGYTSLQFSQRHAFHVTFAGHFFSVFALYWLYRALRAFYRHKDKRLSLLCKHKQRFIVTGLWLVITFIAFLAPLQVARAIQTRTLNQIVASYAKADRKPLQHKTLHWEGRTLFVPEDPFSCGDEEREKETYRWFRTRVLAARFAPGNEYLDPVLMYEWDLPGPAFTSPASVHTRPGVEPGHIDYYFPVHTTTVGGDWERFVGMLLPDHQAERFEGFHEITELERLGGLFGMTVPENPEAFSYTQTLRIPWPHTFPDDYAPGYPPYHHQDEDKVIKQLLSAGDTTSAIEHAEAMLTQRPQSIQFGVLLVRALLQQGDTKSAYAVIDGLRKDWPDDFALYTRLDRCFDRLGGIETRYANWRRLADMDDECAHAFMIRAQKEQEKREH